VQFAGAHRDVPISVVLEMSVPMTLEEALAGKEIPLAIRRELALLDIPHWGFDAAWHMGQMVVHRRLADEVREIFQEIAAARFSLAEMVPVAVYGWSDEVSMERNNSSAFNYRLAVGKTILSQHAYGRAIDLNPVQNPYVKGELVLPPGAVYDAAAPGTVTADGPVVAAFEKRGWTWGGRWTTLKDWQHFEKPQ
jgi:peptidoglycan LD-endopeptidase CwlK